MFVVSKGYLARAVAPVVLLVVDHTELSGRHTVDGVLRVYGELALARRLDGGGVVFRRVAYLEGDACVGEG